MDNLKIVFDLDNALDNKEKALERMNQFISKWKKDYPFLTRMNISESHFTYLEFSFEIRRMIFNVDEDNGRRRKSLQISDYKALSC
ncbi:MAG: hypothetical protein PHU74_01790, partial [Candidatus Pacebacteria bacterium]|nr:hypothetical protein [Candidatus Paceibacterota bacterium]